MLNLVLFEPEIPQNTGNIIRLSANTGARLHLIRPYGFDINDKNLRRAGLDYRDLALIFEYENFADYQTRAKPERIFCLSAKAQKNYADIRYQKNDTFVFGPETRGLPQNLRRQFFDITVPMRPGSRSLNLANCAAVVIYEAWRQLNFMSR